MKSFLLILTAALLTSCAAPVGHPSPPAVSGQPVPAATPVQVTVTINGQPYQVRDGSKISYRGADGRYTKLTVE